MTLLDLCEPLFQYICTLNREARSGGRRDYAAVRSDIKREFEEMTKKAATDVKMASQLKKIELPLIFFVDSMICQSKLHFAALWNQNRLAKERSELAGDDKFFVLLEETLHDHTDDASDRLAIFYLCLWLGFAGPYDRKPDRLLGYVQEILPRIGHVMDRDSKARICADAYKLVDTRSFIEPPSRRIVLMAVLFAFFSLSVLVVYCSLYLSASETVLDSLSQIETNGLLRP